MKSWQQVFQKWSTFQNLDVSLKAKLDEIETNNQALEDAFYKELTFGTGGMRGILGPGVNRMNIYTVRKAVNGLANYLLANRVNVKDRGVVIAYDSRYMSKEFAVEVAKVLGYYGIRTHVFESLRPTPILSFAVRYLGSVAGVMITASHNPPEYNGFKVYNETGGQIVPEEAEKIIASIKETDDELSVPYLELEQLTAKRLITWVGKEVDNAYLERLAQISRLDSVALNQEKELKIVYTPLHGTGLELVTRGLAQLHFPNVHVVEDQAIPDPAFSTVESPNPEEHQAFSRAIALGKQVNADILLGTDPDADRLGVAVKTKGGEYQVLTGNQLGSLLLDYILKRNDPVVYQNARMIKTVVTTELGRAIANSYKVETIDTLTGFKYIGEKINQFTSTGETFVFGYEESYGYLISSFVREKDAIQAAVMAAEMASYWQKQGKTLFDALDELYGKHGYYLEGLSSLTLKGKEGGQQITNIMQAIREQPFKEIAGLKVEKVENYLSGERIVMKEDRKEKINLPRENMMKFMLEQNAWVCLRPSGTEPKIKCYFGVCGNSSEASKQKLVALQEKMDGIIAGIINQ
ncbi:phospho-sugar mutase [Oceanobacillus chungangensis]|uniref:Phosphoglucomutase n=1 Tax=Oceanobacillus chungangensis TaxID=1229152 RepID=A0A3D8PWI1_9BACI|nr:phospho-sugar mutase [Oceanobacillus chungangensis]RDW20486.1 phosphoglucomutase [Oceanobacillus chungangensis]